MPWRCVHLQALHSGFHDLFRLKSRVRILDSGAPFEPQAPDTQVLILGGGVAGVIAARTLANQGITDFLIVEARDELGGRMRSATFGAPNRQLTIELGANWIQGTQEGKGPCEPDFLVGTQTRPPRRRNQKHRTEIVSEYYTFDWEFAQTPEQSSFIASAWIKGASQRRICSRLINAGFKYLIQAEAAEFLHPSQIRLRAAVATIEYSDSGVSVTLTDGTSLTAQYAICTFSLGVLQNDDVCFDPPLPEWKGRGNLQHDDGNKWGCGTYTKIFLQFPEKFWFDTQVCDTPIEIKRADHIPFERGRYPVWQGLDIAGFMPGSGVVFVTVTVAIAPTNPDRGDYSKRVEAMTDAHVQSEVVEVLRAMFPNVTVPEPAAFFFPRWFSDPLYRGSFSTWPASFVPQHRINLRAPLGRLWFSGEAMSEKYFGYLHGAYFEGEATGKQIVECIKDQKCNPQSPILGIQNTYPYGV
ncbi:amine oxidase [Lactarius indigo]|nr:amine oxidase [Lactarius indigo]